MHLTASHHRVQMGRGRGEDAGPADSAEMARSAAHRSQACQRIEGGELERQEMSVRARVEGVGVQFLVLTTFAVWPREGAFTEGGTYGLWRREGQRG